MGKTPTLSAIYFKRQYTFPGKKVILGTPQKERQFYLKKKNKEQLIFKITLFSGKWGKRKEKKKRDTEFSLEDIKALPSEIRCDIFFSYI